MRLLAHIMLVFAAAFVAVNTASAQPVFYSTPKDTITASLTSGVKGSYMFRQYATGTGTLNLSWKQIEAALPTGWEANLCDNGTCYLNLPAAGSMNAVPAGDYGLMKLDITPHINDGTAVIRYAVWDTGTPASSDTLTWIIHSLPAGVVPQGSVAPLVYANGRTLFIRQPSGRELNIRLCDLSGKVVLAQILRSADGAIDLSPLSEGMYVVLVTSYDRQYAQKIVVGCCH
jgi:hypothetical protein